MSKSTIFFALLSLGLAAATGSVVWWLVSAAADRPVQGSLSIGLPLAGRDEPERTVGLNSALVWDTEAQVILFEKNGFERRPIASLTKIMTAMVALDHGIDWDQEATIEPDEYVIGGRLLLHSGEYVTMRDLFHASLMGSANNATLAMVRMSGVEKEEFVREMNRKAIELGLEQTEFVGVTGLDPDNVSTAYEVARLAETAFRDYPIISEVTTKAEYRYLVGGSGRTHTIKNTNKLVTEEGLPLTGGKTGYLYEANFCLLAQGGAALGNRIAVVLGSPSERDSVHDVKTLLYLEYGEL